MSQSIFIKEGPDKRGLINIIEGIASEPPINVFTVTRFICEVADQDTVQETVELADFIIEKLSK